MTLFLIICRAVLNGFGKVGAGDLGLVFEIGDGLGDFEEAVEYARGEVELVGGGLHEGFAFIIHLDEFFEFSGGHFGVGFALPEAFGLAIAGGKDTFAELSGGSAGGDGGEFFGFEARDVDVEVDAVEEGAGNFCAVFEALGSADAVGFRVSLESARAGVHGTDEHCGGGESESGLDSGNGDDVVFERLAQGFEDISAKFGHFIEEEDSVVGERDFARFGSFAAADDCGVAGGVVG